MDGLVVPVNLRRLSEEVHRVLRTHGIICAVIIGGGGDGDLVVWFCASMFFVSSWRHVFHGCTEALDVLLWQQLADLGAPAMLPTASLSEHLDCPLVGAFT